MVSYTRIEIIAYSEDKPNTKNGKAAVIMRDRTQEIRMFEDTMLILKQGWYEKNGRRIPLKLTAEQMQEIQVYLPEDVRKNSSRADFQPPIVIGRCGHGCENMDSFALARKRLEGGADVKAELLYIDMVRRIEHIGDNCFSISESLTNR